MYIWITTPTFAYDDSRLEVVWYFIDALIIMVGYWSSLSSFFIMSYLVVGFAYYWIPFWWYVHDWTHLSLYLPFRNLPSGLSLLTLFTLVVTLFTLQRVVIFDLSNEIFFTRLESQYVYDVKNHTPKDFQDIIFLFKWVLEAMTFQLPLDFHPNFYYLNPHGLTWDKGGSLLRCHMILCFKYQFIPLSQSKVNSPRV